MGVHIDSEEFERMARRLADREGMSVEAALMDLVRRELGQTATNAQEGIADAPQVSDAEVERRRAVVREIQAEMARAPVLDPRPYREILYGEDGLPR